MVDVPPIEISKDALPESLRQLIESGAPIEKRLPFARAIVPMEPVDLVVSLLFLCKDKSENVAKTARKSIESLPWGVLSAGLSETKDPGTLDSAARELLHLQGVPNILALNPHTADSTIAYIASRAKGEVLDIIAANQVRYQRYPKIIEALYYNVNARMGMVYNVLENAVRLGIDLSHIPGYQEIVASIFGESVSRKVEVKALDKVEKEVSETKSFDEIAKTIDQMTGLEAQGWEMGLGLEGAMDDEAFSLLLQAAAWDEGVEEEQEERGKSLLTQIQNLPIPQKVRLALLGNETVRSLLIKDGVRVVYLSVLKSPRLTEKEIIKFAQNKSLNEEVIRIISANKDWTKLYAVRAALVTNPKTPPIQAMQFLKTLNTRDIKNIANSKEVPGYIVRTARQTLAQREMGKT